MVSRERNFSCLRSKKIKNELYPNKKNYWQKVKNEVGFLQKENNLIEDKILKKMRYLLKLKAKNLYLTSVIQQSLAVKYSLMCINDVLRCPIPVDKRRNSDDPSSEYVSTYLTCKINTIEKNLLKEIFNQVSLSPNCLISPKLKKNVLNSTSFTSEASLLQGCQEDV